MNWLKIKHSSASVKLAEIPVLEYDKFYKHVCQLLSEPSVHCGSYFALVHDGQLRFYALMLDDAKGEVLIASHIIQSGEKPSLASLTTQHICMHPFEREIAELYGVNFEGSVWDKPLRFPFDRADAESNINNYPFYSISGDALHEVNVGPIHAGVIEPGAFRFICNGEQVLHLEIALGYQHRGIERQMIRVEKPLARVMLAESIAADSVVAHTTAHAQVMEALSSGHNRGAGSECNHVSVISDDLRLERAIALEMERIAMHIADTGALCMDIAYQLGQVACEALRTIVINTTQNWCGNRFSKGLIRPYGTYFQLNAELAELIRTNLSEVERRYSEVVDNILDTPSVLARFEDCGVVSLSQAAMIGAVGVAARASGLARDLRFTHGHDTKELFGGSFDDNTEHHQQQVAITPVTHTNGDVMARLMVRMDEVKESVRSIRNMLDRHCSLQTTHGNNTKEINYDMMPNADSLSFAMVEGWRGETIHVAVTDSNSRLCAYKIKDPSMHNWLALGLSVRGLGISDFPICNKSFNLSYCGHDL